MPCFPEKGSLKVWLNVITYSVRLLISSGSNTFSLHNRNSPKGRQTNRPLYLYFFSFNLSGFWSPHGEKLDELQNRSSFDHQNIWEHLKSSWRVLQLWCYHGNQVSGATNFKICICFSKIAFNSILPIIILHLS